MRINNNLSLMGQELLPLAEAMLYTILEYPDGTVRWFCVNFRIDYAVYSILPLLLN